MTKVEKDREARKFFPKRMGKKDNSKTINQEQTLSLEDGEIPATSSQSSTESRKRKHGKDVFVLPQQRPKRAKRMVKKPETQDTKKSKVGRTGQREKQLEKEEQDMKIDQMYTWFQDQQRINRMDRRSHSSHKERTRSRSRSRESSSRSKHSPSRSRHSRSRSRDSRQSRSSSKVSSISSRSHKSSHRSKSHSRSRSRSRSVVRKEHELSPSGSEDNLQNIRDVLLRGVGDNPPHLQRADIDPLSQRITSAVKENMPKPKIGPNVSDELGSLMEVYVAKPDFAKVIKMTENYPRPQNVPSISTPELPQDIDKTVDYKIIKEDKRLKNDQICTGATLTALGRVMDVVLQTKHLDPKLLQAGDMLLDGITMLSMVHNDFNTIRLKGFKQTVNPSFGDVFSAKPDEPEMLIGKTPIAEQVKSLEDLNKLKAKLKKPVSTSTPQAKGHQDFRKRGEYHRRQPRNQRYYNRRRDDNRRRRYYSPKGNYRKSQQERAQDDRKPPPKKN